MTSYASQRKAIREAVIASIMSATDLDADHIFRSPRIKIPDASLPSISVYSHGDRPLNEDDDHQRAHERVYTVAIDLQTLGENEEDVTDYLGDLVLRALLEDDSQGGLAFRTLWTSQLWGARASDKNAISGTQLLFDVHYNWRPPYGQ